MKKSEMSRITLTNGSVFEGTPAACVEFAKLYGEIKPTASTRKPAGKKGADKAVVEDKPTAAIPVTAPVYKHVELTVDGKVVKATDRLLAPVYRECRAICEGMNGKLSTEDNKAVFTFTSVRNAKAFVNAYSEADMASVVSKHYSADAREQRAAEKVDKSMSRAIKAVDNIHACSCKGDLKAAIAKAADKYGVSVSALTKAYNANK